MFHTSHSLQRTVHNIVENEDYQIQWMGAELDILAEDGDGNEVTVQEAPTIVSAASTSNDTRTVHLAPSMVVKKEEQVRCQQFLTPLTVKDELIWYLSGY